MSVTILQSAIHLSWSAVIGNPYFAEGMIVPFISSRCPSATVVIVNDFSCAFRRRLLDGVKNPSDARFFSTFTNSVDGRVSDRGWSAVGMSPLKLFSFSIISFPSCITCNSSTEVLFHQQHECCLFETNLNKSKNI